MDGHGVETFNPAYWAGIDCSGLVQRGIDSSRDTAQGLRIAIPAYPSGVKSQAFFTDTARALYLGNPVTDADKVRLQKKPKRGNLVLYRGHVLISHSEKPSCNNITCTYEIIHPSGVPEYKPLDENGEDDGPREVVTPYFIKRRKI